MNPETKSQWKSAGKTSGVVGLVAAVVIGVTQIVLPPAPKMVNPWTFKSPVEGTSNWDIVYKWCYRDNVRDTNWTFWAYTTNTTAITVDLTNKHRFYTITEYFLTGFPTNIGDMSRFRWYRTN